MYYAFICIKYERTMFPTVSNIVDSLNEIGIMPLPSPHDAQPYNSSRVVVIRDMIL